MTLYLQCTPLGIIHNYLSKYWIHIKPSPDRKRQVPPLPTRKLSHKWMIIPPPSFFTAALLWVRKESRTFWLPLRELSHKEAPRPLENSADAQQQEESKAGCLLSASPASQHSLPDSLQATFKLDSGAQNIWNASPGSQHNRSVFCDTWRCQHSSAN